MASYFSFRPPRHVAAYSSINNALNHHNILNTVVSELDLVLFFFFNCFKGIRFGMPPVGGVTSSSQSDGSKKKLLGGE